MAHTGHFVTEGVDKKGWRGGGGWLAVSFDTGRGRMKSTLRKVVLTCAVENVKKSSEVLSRERVRARERVKRSHSKFGKPFLRQAGSQSRERCMGELFK